MECQEKLVPLLSRSFPDIEVRAENRRNDPIRDDFDYHLPMGSLYRQFFSALPQGIKSDAFLIPDPVRVDYWKERLRSLGDGPFVGIAWKSSNISPGRANNYAPIAEWEPLLTLPQVNFINLQYADYSSDLTAIESELGVRVHTFEDLDLFNDLDDVAALCKALDSVVSTTSAVPRISAGVGTTTKFLCWRQSPWNNVLSSPLGPRIEQFDRNTWERWSRIITKVSRTF